MTKGEIIPESAVRFVRTLPGPVEKVWAMLTETKRLPEWYGDGAIEPREGGKVQLMGGHIRGVVTGWRPHEFLAYTWNVFDPGEASASSSEVVGQSKKSRFPISYLEFALASEAKAVKLTLTHRPIPAEFQKQTAMGWHTMLDLIEAGLNGEFPKRSDLFPVNAALYGVDISTLQR
jgi:uncharacterized protein YndB with AHSA1/START domain